MKFGWMDEFFLRGRTTRKKMLRFNVQGIIHNPNYRNKHVLKIYNLMKTFNFFSPTQNKVIKVSVQHSLFLG